VNRVALVMHTTSYGAGGFVAACARVGASIVVASDRCHVLDRAWQWPADALVIDFADPDGAAAAIAAAHSESAPIRAVLPVGGELPAKVAAAAARRLGLPANAPAAMTAATNKLALRTRLAAPLPRFISVARDADPDAVAPQIEAPGGVGFPCVVKPLMLSGSRGVMRADDRPSLAAALARLGRLLADPAVRHPDPAAADLILIESFVPGPEFAVEGMLTRGELETIALFDKPDPLDGPTFEETLYITPSRVPARDQQRIIAAAAAGARALGLETGPVHAELRWNNGDPALIDLAARPIGGLCARSLRFAGGLSLEDVVVGHALGAPVPARQHHASGVMMIPAPARVPSALRAVSGVEDARAVAGIDDVVISTRIGETVVPLPEGSHYTGFIFASGESPVGVEAALRTAAERLRFTVAPLVAVTR
jgi:biotin carboxylase